MTTLLELREKIKIFMGKYDIYIIPLMKFLLALIAFTMINGSVGFMEKAKNPAISLILALMCSFLPVNLIAVFGGILVLAHAYALSLEFFVIAFVVILLMVLLFFRTAPQYGYLLILTPMAFVLKVPYVVPLAMGLVGTPAAAVPVACGTVAYYLLHYMKLNTTMLSEAETESMKQKITYLIDNEQRDDADGGSLCPDPFDCVCCPPYVHRLLMEHCNRNGGSGGVCGPASWEHGYGCSAEGGAGIAWERGIRRTGDSAAAYGIQYGLFPDRICTV